MYWWLMVGCRGKAPLHMRRNTRLQHVERGCCSIAVTGSDFAICFTRSLPLDETHQVCNPCSLTILDPPCPCCLTQAWFMEHIHGSSAGLVHGIPERFILGWLTPCMHASPARLIQGVSRTHLRFVTGAHETGVLSWPRLAYPVHARSQAEGGWIPGG